MVVLGINRSVSGSIGAYRWIESDQEGTGDADKQPLTKSFPRRRDLQNIVVQTTVTAIKTRSLPPKAGWEVRIP